MRKGTGSFSWKNREQDLASVKRYHSRRVMFYRTNLAVHSLRVQGILAMLLPGVFSTHPDFNPELARLISKFHDDPEMASKRGDVQLGLKYLMSPDEKARLREEEVEAAELLSRSYGNPEIGGYRYLDLVMHGMSKDIPEAQLHSFADKLDGYGEALHEVLAGNLAFLEPVINYMAQTFNDLPGHFPLIADAFKPDNPLFHFPVVKQAIYFEGGKAGSFLHTPESVEWESGIVHYELWKVVTKSMPGGVDLLTTQTEFY